MEEDAVGDDRVGEPPGGVSVARPQRGAGGRCRRSLEVRVSDGDQVTQRQLLVAVTKDEEEEG